MSCNTIFSMDTLITAERRKQLFRSIGTTWPYGIRLQAIMGFWLRSVSDQHASLILYLFNNECIWILLCVNLPDYTIGVCTIVCTATSASLRQATKGGGRDNAESRQTGRQNDQSGATFSPNITCFSAFLILTERCHHSRLFMAHVYCHVLWCDRMLSNFVVQCW